MNGAVEATTMADASTDAFPPTKTTPFAYADPTKCHHIQWLSRDRQGGHHHYHSPSCFIPAVRTTAQPNQRPPLLGKSLWLDERASHAS
jgi:hypothetical protein